MQVLDLIRQGRLRTAGSLCAALALLVFATGCPFTPRPQCNEDSDCDDGTFCNGAETCNAEGACAAGTAPCAEGDTCNEDANRCDECTTAADCNDNDVCTTDACADGQCANTAVVGCCNDNADCDDATFCNGAETCVNNACVAGTSPCTDDQLCSEQADACVECLFNADCDDGVFCNGAETCAANFTCEAGAAPCTDTQECVELTDTCVEIPTCTDDADCDDDLFCTGTETCVAGQCVAGTSPCTAGQTCNEAGDNCFTEGTGFDLTTDDDVLTGTVGNDVFTAAIGTLNPNDIVVGNGGTDELNATVAGSTSGGATLIDIDTVTFTTLNGVTFDAVNSAAVGTFVAAGTSSGALTLKKVEEGTDVAMGSGFAKRLHVDQSGGTDLTELNLGINNAGTGAIFQYTQAATALATLNIAATGANTLSPSNGTFFGQVTDVVVTGSGSLTLSGATPGNLSSPVDASALTGEMAVSGLAATFDFSDGGADEVLGIDRVTVSDTAGGGNAAFTFENGPVTIGVASIPADASLGTVAVTFDAAGSTRTATVALGGAGDGTGAFTGTDVRTLNIQSGGTTDNAITGVNIGGVGFPFPIGQTGTTLNVSGDMNLNLGLVVADIINAAGFTGDLTITNTGSNVGQSITGGDGDDTLIGGNGADIIAGGAGVDTFGFHTIVSNANRNIISDFVGGADGDKLGFDATTFTKYAAAATVTFALAAGITDGAGVTNQIIRDTAANIAGIDTSGGNGANPIAIATDTGNIYYDADGDYSNAVIIGNIPTAEVADLVAANVVIVP